MTERLLAKNFIEISYAENSRDLIAFGHRIFHVGYGWGRVIKWLLAIFPFLGNKEEMLKKASIKTRDLFFEKLEHLSKAEKQLKCGIKRVLKGKEIKGAKFYKAKNYLLRFLTHLEPFMKIVRKEKDAKILSFLLSEMKNPSEVKETATLIKDLFIDLHIYQKIFNFEECTSIEIPLFLLKKMSLDHRLSLSEEKKVKKWLDQLNHSLKTKVPTLEGETENGYVKTRYMHRLLCQIVMFINENISLKESEDFNFQVEALEANLVNLGYQAFDHNDFRHIEWRKNLKEGETIILGEKVLTLGEIIVNPENNFKEPVVFSIVNEPSLEVVIYHNEAYSYLKRFQESILHCGIRGQKIFGISAFGRIVIQERLYDSLLDIQWNSKDGELTRADKEKAKPIIELLKELKKRPFTPQPLYPELFAFNNNNELKAVDCLVPGYFSFDALENFAFECSKKNQYLFSHIMREAGLGTLKEARLYQELFLDALNNRDADKAITRNSSIQNPTILKKRADFYYIVKDDFRECLDFHVAKYEIKNMAQFQAILTENLKIHKEILCPGRIHVNYLFAYALYPTLVKYKPNLKKEAFIRRTQNLLKSQNLQKLLIKENESLFHHYGIYHMGQIGKVKREIRQKLKEGKKGK